MSAFDFIVIGSGIAGASAAAELTLYGSVAVLEREDMPGYHTTGRSAAMLALNYGGKAFRKLTRASKAFFDQPPDGFSAVPLSRQGSGCLFIAGADQMNALGALETSVAASGGQMARLSAREAADLCPALKTSVVTGALYEPGDLELDVAALHQGYLSALKRRGGEIVTRADVRAVRRTGAGWTIEAGGETYRGTILVNAAGAWGDDIARLAGISPVGLSPMRRTAITFALPSDMDAAGWPLCISAAEDFYFRPSAGAILASPANEDLMPPCDVQPEELDIALCMERVGHYTTLTVTKIASRWAGLRTFTSDRGPCVGPDPADPSFIWCVGQGGYGIQSAPAMGRLTAALAASAEMPADLRALGLTQEQVGASRFRRS